jgi:hypothetical protein
MWSAPPAAPSGNGAPHVGWVGPAAFHFGRLGVTAPVGLADLHGQGFRTANIVTSTVESAKQNPLKFATGLAVGIGCAFAVVAICATGVGCLILAGVVAGAAAAGAEYGVSVA